MNTLLIEIIACLFAAAFLSLFIGWAIRSSLANKEIEATNANWESKQSQLELRYQEDTDELKGQVDRLQTESTQLNTRNDSISESLRENEISVHKARADAIELNRQQADTQERLQRIIAQKDEELKRLKNTATVAGAAGVAGVSAVAAASSTTDDTEAKIAKLSAKREAWESERARLINGVSEDQATVAIDRADVPYEPLDQTVRIDPNKASDHSYIDETIALDDADRTLTLENDQTQILDKNKPRDPNPDGDS